MYLLRVVVGVPTLFLPSAKMPRVALPVAEPRVAATLAAPTPHAVLVQLAKVYLLRVVEAAHAACPRAKIPRVAFPAAEPNCVAALAAPTPTAVLVQEA